MKQYTEEEMLGFANFAKSYQSPKDIKKALKIWDFSQNTSGVPKDVDLKGSIVLRVPGGNINKAKTFYFLTEAAGKDKNDKDAKYPTSVNLTDAYVRVPDNDLSPLKKGIVWGKNIFLKALGYIPNNDGGDNKILFIITNAELQVLLWDKVKQKYPHLFS